MNRTVEVCDAPKGHPCALERRKDGYECIRCVVRHYRFEEMMRDSSPGRGTHVCKENLPGPCAIAKQLGHECLVCQLRHRGGELAILQDEYQTLEMKIERLRGFEKSEVERQRLETEVEGSVKRTAALIKSCGREERCRGATCEATIYFIRTKAGKQAHYDLDGTTHYATCPDSKSLQQKRT